MVKKTVLKARGILEYKNNILFCYNKTHSFYFLPGGKLEPHENLHQCLRRELQEECKLSVSVGKLLGCLECHWQEDSTQYQEINLIFEIASQERSIPTTIKSLEDHIDFVFLDKEEVEKGKYHVLPKSTTQFLNDIFTLHYLFESQLKK